MDAIPCADFFVETIDVVPVRIKRTDPDAIADRWANFVYNMDLTPPTGDPGQSAGEIDTGNGAWSLWDLPVTHAAQIDDENGDDLVCVASGDRVYWLDWNTYRDEWAPNTYAPIYRMLSIGPIPSSEKDVGDLDLDVVKQFVEFQFSLRDAPTAGDLSRWRISVAEWDHVDSTQRIVERRGAQRMRARVAAQGRSFVVRLEHAANEPVRIEHWTAMWRPLGRRIPEARRSR